MKRCSESSWKLILLVASNLLALGFFLFTESIRSRINCAIQISSGQSCPLMPLRRSKRADRLVVYLSVRKAVLFAGRLRLWAGIRSE